MALARCEDCGRPKGNKGNVYDRRPRFPTGYPDSGVICGSDGCENSAVIWLLLVEAQAYRRRQRPQRIFELPTASVKVRVQ